MTSPNQQMFVTIFVAFLGSGIINLMLNHHYAKKAQKNNKENAIGDGIQCLLRDRIMALCAEYEEVGWCDQMKKTSLQKMYDAYAALGGNDVAHSEYVRVMELKSIQ